MQKFKIVVTLDKIFRKDGQYNDQQRFCELLTNSRDANQKIDDWNLLMLRIPVWLNASTNDEFGKVVHLFSTNNNIHNHNMIILYSLMYLVSRRLATKKRNCNIVEDGSTNELELELLISKDSRVMLTTNL